MCRPVAPGGHKVRPYAKFISQIALTDDICCPNWTYMIGHIVGA